MEPEYTPYIVLSIIALTGLGVLFIVWFFNYIDREEP